MISYLYLIFIEITHTHTHTHVVPRVGGRGLKFSSSSSARDSLRRPPRRGTRIEIQSDEIHQEQRLVVPRVGGRGLK